MPSEPHQRSAQTSPHPNHVYPARTGLDPLENYEEIKDGSTDAARDLLYAWITEVANKSVILLEENVDPSLVDKVVKEGYAPDLTDDELEQIGRDPFLIAYVLASAADRCVVTTEVSKPKKFRQNRRIPDVCAAMGVQCCDTFAMLRALKFSTNWAK